MFAVRLGKGDDFIGKAALVRPQDEPLRKKLVTIVLDTSDAYAWGGEALVVDGEPVGEISSAGWSDAAGRCVALGYVRGAAAAARPRRQPRSRSICGARRWRHRRGILEPRQSARRHRHARLVSCPRPSALSHLTVLDLTRVRAGPTACASSPTGAPNVIKIECRRRWTKAKASAGRATARDFQNLHRNKREHDART